MINSSPLGENGRHLTDKFLDAFFMSEKFCILMEISLKFAPKGVIDKKSALVQVMAWHRTGDKPLPEAILTQLYDTYIQHWGEMS